MKRWIILLPPVLLGGFFVISGGLKLAAPEEFYRAVLRYRMMEGEAAWAVALLIPWLEVLAGGFLFLRAWRKASALVILALLFVFEAILASAFLRGLDIECGCLGSGGGTSVGMAFVRNLFLIAAGLTILRTDHTSDEAAP
ncbi:MAG: MauE/DoxX family redox-associated membrane protein [Oceanipulchritudo sp.]